MPRRYLTLGPMRATLEAGRDGAALSVGLGGDTWRRLYRGLADHLRARRDAAPPAPRVTTGDAEAAALRARVAEIGWYHTLDLGHGIRTPGEFDHAPHLAKYRLPATLAGQRVLDIGAFDGYWAFEFERRGAASVVALDVECFADLDFPPPVRGTMSAELLASGPGQGFRLAHEVLASRVERRLGNVYTLGPDAWGTFDLTHIGNVLVHLRDPALALQRMCTVTGGTAIISETVDPDLDGDAPLIRYAGGRVNCNWWRYSEAALLQMVRDAGFRRVETIARFGIPLRASARDMVQVVIHAHNR